MRKHNRKFALRWNRWLMDRTNFPQRMAHSFVNDKLNMLWANSLLQSLIARV